MTTICRAEGWQLHTVREGKRDTCRRQWTPTKTTYMTDSVRRTENRAKTGSARWTRLPWGLFINYGRVSHNGVSGIGCLLMNRVTDGPSDYAFCRRLVSRLHFVFLSLSLFLRIQIEISSRQAKLSRWHTRYLKIFETITRNTHINIQ